MPKSETLAWLRQSAAAGQTTSVVLGPTDEELLEAIDEATAAFYPRHPEAEPLTAVEYARELEIRKARAVLARWGNHPTPEPANDGPAVPNGREPASVAVQPTDDEPTFTPEEAEMIAAPWSYLQPSLPAPIPLSERLPTEADCDAKGKCWLFGKVEGDWRRLNPHNSGVPKLSYCFSHWLPVHAIPLPEA